MSEVKVKKVAFFTQVQCENGSSVYKCLGCKQELKRKSFHGHLKRSNCGPKFAEFEKQKQQVEKVEITDVLVYTRAKVHEDVFISSAYKRVARPSSYVQVHFADLGCFIGQILFFVRVPLKDPSQEHAHESEDNHLLRLPAGDAFNSAKALRLAVIRFFQRLHLEPPASGSDIRRDTDVDEEVPRIQRFDPSRCLPCEAHDPCIITNKCIVTTVKPYYAIPYTQLTQTSRK
jgi:hypothetical protein